ncbi:MULTISPECIES: YdgA family protein [Gibbsiella]|uniref:YdgA family protein n=1 Tax=Gibbsiella dentisursi TaxID=796890 RepID=A0ABP7L0Z5_9GAMM|nr:YdgA family protein [Gibbsiella quercinecans]
MKKSLVAVSVIVILGAAWTGAAWYTGKLIEQRMGEMVDNANNQLKKDMPQFGMTLSFDNYQRGLFSSQVRFVLRTDNAIGYGLLKPGDEVVLQDTIDHGPFPLAQLKKFNLMPSMASLHTRLENTPALKTLFDITKGQPLFSADSRISYSGTISTVAEVIPVDYQKDATSVKFSGATINSEISRDMKGMSMSLQNASTVLSGPNQFGQVEQITLQDVKYTGNSRLSSVELALGDQSATIKQMNVAIDGKDTVQLDGFSLVSKFGEQESNINGQLDYTLDAMKVLGNDFGSSKLTIKIDRLDSQSVKAFAENYNKQALALVQKINELDKTEYQRQATDTLLQNLPLLLKGNPSVSIAPLSWKNSKGESNFTLKLDLADPTQAGGTTAAQNQPLANAVKTLDAKLSIPVAMATETTAQAARLQGYNAEEAQKLAQQQVQGLAAMGQMFKLTTLKDDVIGSSFHYADNQVDLNGNKMTLQEFIGLFGLMSGPAQQ